MSKYKLKDIVYLGNDKMIITGVNHYIIVNMRGYKEILPIGYALYNITKKGHHKVYVSEQLLKEEIE